MSNQRINDALCRAVRRVVNVDVSLWGVGERVPWSADEAVEIAVWFGVYFADGGTLAAGDLARALREAEAMDEALEAVERVCERYGMGRSVERDDDGGTPSLLGEWA